MTHKPVVVVAGASGFVGEALTKQISRHCQVVGLSRNPRKSKDDIEWRSCDLFSLKQTEQALAGAELAVYLVHSMMPQARLVQGNFSDFDVIIADNFARACKSAGVKKIVYLSGIIPEGRLSDHLKSRLEVETVLSSYQIPVVVVRAGLIVGTGGSSFLMMVKLVERLPLMICPAWTTTLGQPSSLEDAVSVLERALFDEKMDAGHWDIGAFERLSYLEMMRIVARRLGKKRLFFPVPFLSVGFSKLWVSVVTGSPKQLVNPLIQSLKTPMLVGPRDLFKHYKMTPLNFSDCVVQALAERPSSKGVLSKGKRAGTPQHPEESLVCSMQRLVMPQGKDVRWVSDEYGRWVVQFMFPLIHVETEKSGDFNFTIRLFLFFGPKLHLLKLHYDQTRSSESRQLYYIKGGLLVHRNAPESARLEFRKLPGGREVMAAIFNFRPAMPWWVYKFSQAFAHLWVMRNFGRHLKGKQAP